MDLTTASRIIGLPHPFLVDDARRARLNLYAQNMLDRPARRTLRELVALDLYISATS